jgi:predicted DNA-binding ribbon-helix-helix protein
MRGRSTLVIGFAQLKRAISIARARKLPLHRPMSAFTKERSTLVSRNVSVRGRRTSIRLEPSMWEALFEIVEREGRSLSAIVSLIEEERRASSLTSAIRTFIVAYFRDAATEEGHRGANHGMRQPPV